MSEKATTSESNGLLMGVLAILGIIGVIAVFSWFDRTQTIEIANTEEEENSFIMEQLVYLEENAKKDGVMVTESGLQYRVLTNGQGDKRPAASDAVLVHYEGRLISGEVFDSSYARGEPIDFPLRGVIPGWTEGLQYMAIGDKFELTIPSELAYGKRGGGNVIPPDATLVFDVELLDILK